MTTNEVDRPPREALGDDQPKHNPWREDALGYAPFAQRLANTIIQLSAPNGYVIALHGRWGTGKSTAINFVLEYVKKHNDEHPQDVLIHVPFRPWIVSARQDLITAFFKILSENLGPRESRLKRSWRKLVHFVNGTTDPLIDTAAKLAIVAAPAYAPAAAAAVVVKKSVGRAIDKFLAEPSLQKAYDDLKTQLAASAKRFLITIDDIDRLEDVEIKAIMQMVKSIGALPNVTYLLAYDRDIVSEALEKRAAADGMRFSDKIVQQELELPTPSRAALLALLDKEIAFITQAIKPSLRWHYILRDGVHRWMRSPRDVVRLSNALKFAWPAVKDEFDPQDLIAMEGLRLFDEHVFDWIRRSRDFFFGEGFFAFANDGAKKSYVDGLMEQINVGEQAQVLHLLSTLFPQCMKHFRDQFANEVHIEVLRRRGIGSPAGFDAYFALHPSADAIPRSLVSEMIRRSDDLPFLESVLREHLHKENRQRQAMISLLLDELRVMFDCSAPATPSQALLDALFRVGPEIMRIDRPVSILEAAPMTLLDDAIRAVLARWTRDEAGQHLLAAFTQTNSLAFQADIYISRGEELGKFRSSRAAQPVISEQSFVELGDSLLKNITQAAASGDLLSEPFFGQILRSWAHLQTSEVVRTWLSTNMTESSDFLRRVGLGLLYFSTGSDGKRYSMKEAPDSALYDLDVVIGAGESYLKDPRLTTDERSVIAELVRGAHQAKAQRAAEEVQP